MRRLAFLLLSLLAFAFVSCAPKPALDAEQTPKSRYTGDVGESPVGVIPEGSLRDSANNRELKIAVDYPTRKGPHPLLIFSHSFGGSPRDYIGLSSFWASQGYVVVRPSHADAGRAAASSRSMQDAWESQTPNDWRMRVQDVTLLIDQLDLLEQTYPELQGKIERTKIGVAGHVHGAFTAMLAGGARTFPGPAVYADPRVKAIVAMSPPGPGATRGLTDQSFAELRTPALFITGTGEEGANETETVEWRRQAYNLAPAGDKWLVVMEGTNHSAYTGRMQLPGELREVIEPTPNPHTGGPFDSPAPVPPQQRRLPTREDQAGMRVRNATGTVKALSLAFWDAYLKGDAEGREALEKAASRMGVTVEKK
jgi:predicted dienelactone hydrolase